MVLTALTAGCITSTRARPEYVRDGVQYGDVGMFRGRWWSYYERGRSFSDGEFWAEAEKDFRTALSIRDGDQLWPRTYGLHFLPEYFPLRELGVALYHQEKWDEAIQHLDQSLERQPSARAEYFRERTLRGGLESAGGDTEPPSVEVIKPGSATAVVRRLAEIEAIARDDQFVAGITVNGERVLVARAEPEIRFRRWVALEPGQNEIRIEVEDLVGKTTTHRVEILSDVDGPAVSFDQPVVVPGTIRGVAADPGGIESVVVAGREATILERTAGRVEFEVTVSERPADGPVLFECKDTRGNATGGRLPLDVLQLSDAAPSVVFAKGPTTVDIGNGLHAFFVGGQPVMIAKAPPEPGPPAIRFLSVRDENRYFREEIIVAFDVTATAPLAALELNGRPVQIVPGRSIQSASRRILLAPGENSLEVRAVDRDGQESRETVAVTRHLTPMESPASRLQAAVLGSVWTGRNNAEEEAEIIPAELENEPALGDRFNLVDRGDLLAEAIEEQGLNAALASKQGRIDLGRLLAAEVMFIGRVRKDYDGTIEIILEGISTETAMFVARADVAGPAGSLDELTRLVNDLALRITQEFPDPEDQGTVTRVRGAATIKSPTIVAVSTDPLLDENPFQPGAADIFIDELERELRLTEGYSLVDRRNLDQFIAEQTLAQATSRVVPADYLFEVSGRSTGGTCSVSMRIVDPDTSEQVNQGEASGPASTADDLRLLARKLVAETVEQVPAKDGGAPLVVAERFVTTLSEKNRIQESMKCVVFRHGDDIIDPLTKEVIGRETEIVCEALIRAVDDQKSEAELIALAGRPSSPLKEGDFIAAK